MLFFWTLYSSKDYYSLQKIISSTTVFNIDNNLSNKSAIISEESREAED